MPNGSFDNWRIIARQALCLFIGAVFVFAAVFAQAALASPGLPLAEEQSDDENKDDADDPISDPIRDSLRRLDVSTAPRARPIEFPTSSIGANLARPRARVADFVPNGLGTRLRC